MGKGCARGVCVSVCVAVDQLFLLYAVEQLWLKEPPNCLSQKSCIYSTLGTDCITFGISSMHW